jgi:DNA polymerase-3 subunit alpha (Gram-positive type)
MNGREDTCREKHIELHVRTGYSGMYGFGSPDQFLNLAAEWEQPAIAFTDFGVTGGFPAISRLAERSQLKVIYVCEVIMLPTDCGILPVLDTMLCSSL